MTDSDLVQLDAGTVSLHDARRDRRWEVELEPFAIGRTPVTDGAYFELQSSLSEPGLSEPGQGEPGLRESGRPVTNISWMDALKFCNQVSQRDGLPVAYEFSGHDVHWVTESPGYRLPTEAEWEYACRAGTSGARYDELGDIAWSVGDERTKTQAVGLKQPNAFGLFDTLGNAWEWCWDLLDPARYGDYRVFRGGGFADQPWSVRASVRRGGSPTVRFEDLGFRMARGAVAPGGMAQGWSARADIERAQERVPRPIGWTPRSR